MVRTRTLWLILLAAAVVLGAACEDEVYSEDQRIDDVRHSNARRAAAKRTVTPGPATTPPPVPVTATAPPEELRYGSTSEITAVFDQGTFTTTYTLKMTGAFPQGGLVEWSGANCGTVSGERYGIADVQRLDTTEIRSVFVWVHPHPPCGNTADHVDATIVATLLEGDGRPGRTPLFRTTCTYRGSATGTGQACQRAQETR